MKYFSKDYQQARTMFLRAAKKNGAQIKTYECPYPGPEGEKLYTDTALIGKGDEKTVLVISSGTHGVEGFAGSCIQTGLLSEGFPEKLTKGVAIMMIHAVNPHGFSHIRRFNENNVDINRNFVDHPQPYPENKNHAKLAAVLAPKKLGFFSAIQLYATLLLFVICYGPKTLIRAVGGGQNILPRGLYYGGTTESWSNETVISVIKNCANSAENLIVLDIHTGLGSFGKAVILLDSTHTTACDRAKQWWPDFKVPDTSKGIYYTKLTGPLPQQIVKKFPCQEVTAATIEFGSQKWWQKVLLKALFSVRAENWFVHFGGNDSRNEAEFKRKLKKTFCPDSKKWQSQVWFYGREIVHKVLEGIK